MTASTKQIIQFLFGTDSLEEVSLNQLRELTREYPAFNIAHYLLSKKLQLERNDSFLPETQKTALYFTNPFWLQLLLEQDTKEQLQQPEISEPVSTGTFAADTIFNKQEEHTSWQTETAIEETTAQPEKEELPSFENTDVRSWNREELSSVLQSGSLPEEKKEEGWTGFNQPAPADEEIAPSLAFYDQPQSHPDQSAATQEEEQITPPLEEVTGQQAHYPEPEPHTDQPVTNFEEDQPSFAGENLSNEARPTPYAQTASDAMIIDEEALPFIQENIHEKAAEPEIQPEPSAEEPVTEQTAVTNQQIYEETETPEPDSAASGSFTEQPEAIKEEESPSIAHFSDTTETAPPIPQPEPTPDHKETAEPALTFEPYHTIDYFASLGIRFQSDENPTDKFGKQLKSFTDWLKTMKRLPKKTIEESEPDEAENAAIQSIAEHSIEEKDVVTEAMAEVLARQGKTEKAIEVYLKLSLLNPGKSAYFAARIQQLKTY